MKKEANKKSKLWILIVAIIAALLLVGTAVVGAIVGIPALLALFGGSGDTDGNATPQSPVYWNLDRVQFTQDSETGLSTREKGDDGMYHLRMICGGQLMDMATADKQLVNFMDTMDAMGLVLDENGLIIDVLNVKDIATETAKNFYVKAINGNTVTVNSSIAMNGMDVQLVLTETAAVSDVRLDSETLGQKIVLDIMDMVCVYSNAEGVVTDIFLLERPAASELYLRVDSLYDATTAMTTRVPDENGVYTIPFAVGGKVVELKCKDKNLVTSIDSGTDTNQVMGLTFDEEGYITGKLVAATAIRGRIACNVYNVTAINGTTIEVTRLGTGSEQGKVVTFNLTEETEIVMNEIGCGHFIGEYVPDLKMNDRVIVWVDMNNNAKYVKIDRRQVDYPMYYLQVKKWDSTTQQTTRVPENGYYVYEMASKGKIVTVKTKSKELANLMDGNSWQFFGLRVENGIVKEYFDANCISGGYGIGGQRFVTQVMPTIVRIVSGSDFNSGGNYMLSPETEIYDMTGAPGTKLGAKTTLREGDRVIANRTVDNFITHIYVLDRYQTGCKIYYNAARKYNATTLETTRALETEGPNEGYYVFKMYVDGKVVEVKTKDKAIATIIDAQNAPIVAMKVNKDNVITAAFPAIAGQKFTSKVLNYNYVGEITADKTISCYYFSNGEKKDASMSYKMAKNCKVYNVSSNYSDHPGEKSTLKKGDRIQALLDIQTGELTHIWIMGRMYDAPLYFHVERKGVDKDGNTNREPDAEGYYSVQLFVDGKIKTFRTKSKEIMSQVDTFGSETFFILETNGDIILKTGSAAESKRAVNNIVSHYDVTKVSGKKVTLTRMRPGSSNLGDVKEITLDSKTQVYDVCYYSPNQFKAVKLEKGDRVLAYADLNGNVTYAFVMYAHTRVNGTESKCPHCNKVVWWEHWTGAQISNSELTHYYMPTDRTRGQGQVGYDETTTPTALHNTIVFDMNGCTLTSTARNFLVYSNLVLIDTVGGGVLEAQGGAGFSGGNFLVIGGNVDVYDGITIRMAENAKGAGSGGNFNVSNKEVKDADGKTLRTYTGTINIHDAVIEGWPGVTNSNFNMNAGTVLNVSGGKIKNGTTGIANNAVLNASGGSFENAKISPSAKSIINLSGNLKVSGDGIDLREGAKITTSKLSGDAKVVVQAYGIFTEKLSNAAAQKPYYEAERKFYPVEVKDSALWTDRDPSKPDYQPEAEVPAKPEVTVVDKAPLALDSNSQAKCPVCNEVVTWIAIKDATKAQELTDGQHYYLAADITFEAKDHPYIQVAAQKSACLHLNNHNITATNAMAVLVNGSLNIMGDGVVSGNGYSDEKLASLPHLHAATIEVNSAKAVLNLYGGTYVKSADNDSRVLMVTNSTTKELEEKAAGNHIVGVHGNGGTINMFDGAVIDASGTKKEAFRGFWGMFNLYGGTVQAGSGNAITAGNWSGSQSGSASIYGGVVKGTVNGSGIKTAISELNLFGGEMQGNVTYNANAKVTVAGNPVVPKLVVPTNRTGEYEGLIFLGKLTEGANINVTGSGIFTYQCANVEEYLQYFHSLTADAVVVNNFALGFYVEPVPEIPEKIEKMPAYTDELEFLDGSRWAVCAVCEKYVAWKPITQAAFGDKCFTGTENGLHLYLAEDVTYTGTETFINAPGADGNKNVPYTTCIHLNGHNFTATNTNVAHGSNGSLNILGTGTVSGNGKNGAAITINTNKDVGGGMFLYSGTYTKPASNASGVVQVNSNGGRIWIGKDATIVTEPGVLAAKVSGGNLISGHLVIEGTVKGGYVESALKIVKPELECDVILELKDANLEGGAKLAQDTLFAVSGETKINGLDMTSGNVILMSDLSGDAKIIVKANGFFTDDLDDANGQLKYYEAAAKFLPVEVKAGKLWTDRAPNAPDYVDDPEVPALPALLKTDNSDLVLDANNQAKCPVCDKVVTWTAITQADINNSAEDYGYALSGDTHYYLAESITYTGSKVAIGYPWTQENSGKTACLHLNGNNLTATNGIAFFVGLRLNVMGNGVVTGNGKLSNRAATFDTNSTAALVNLYGGTYTKSANNDFPVLTINAAGGTLNIYDGVTVDGRENKGDVVRTWNGTLNIYGGTIYGGTTGACVNASNSTHSGNPVAGTVNIFGGLLQATNGSGAAANGSASKKATLNIYGGEIKGTTQVKSTANVTIGGTAKMNRLHVDADQKITLAEMSEGASIDVIANGIFTNPSNNANAYVKYFHGFSLGSLKYKTPTVVENALFTEEGTDEPGTGPEPEPEPVAPAIDNSDLVFEEGTTKAKCPVCNEVVEWIAITQAEFGTTGIGDVTEAGKHYYLAEDINYTGTTNFIRGPGNSGKLCIHLNGHNYTGAAPFLFGWGSKSCVMGNGIVANANNTAKTGAIVWNTGTKTNVDIQLYGGIYTVTKDNVNGSAILINTNGGDITIHPGATVIGSKTAPAIYVGTSSIRTSVLTINGATVDGILKVYPLNVSAGYSTTITLDDATVAQVDLGKDVSFIVKGDTKIHQLNIDEGAKITVGDLTSNAKINVKGNGVISEANAKMSTYFGMFTSYGCQLSVENNALVARDLNKISNAALSFTEGTTANCPYCQKSVEWIAIKSTDTYIRPASGAHYYLPEDVTVNAAGNGHDGFFEVMFADSTPNVCLHLNGHNLTVNGHRALMIAPGTLNVMGQGIVAGDNNDGSTIHVNGSNGLGVINLFGGTIKKVATNTTGSVAYIGNNGGTINMYAGAAIDGKDQTFNAVALVRMYGNSTNTKAVATFNMYGGTIKDGVNTGGNGGNVALQHANNSINANAVFNMYAGTISGGKAEGKQGGNIYAFVNDSPENAKAELNLLGGTIAGGTAFEGGNIHVRKVPIVLQNVTVSNGTAAVTATATAAHGGNISSMYSTVTINAGTLISGGTAAAQGGNLRCYLSSVTMNGGVITDGQAGVSWRNHNIWLVGNDTNRKTMVMNGGLIVAKPDATMEGSGVDLATNATLYLGGSATIVDSSTSTKGAIDASSGCNIRVLDGWCGSASFKQPTVYAAAAQVPTTALQIVKLDAGMNETAGGSITGHLYQLNDGTCIEALPQADGSFKMAG